VVDLKVGCSRLSHAKAKAVCRVSFPLEGGYLCGLSGINGVTENIHAWLDSEARSFGGFHATVFTLRCTVHEIEEMKNHRDERLNNKLAAWLGNRDARKKKSTTPTTTGKSPSSCTYRTTPYGECFNLTAE